MPFQPGQSGNPSGRPRGAAGLARYIRERVGENLEELVDIALSIARDSSTPRRERLSALSILFDRAAGKPHQSSSVAVAATSIQLPPGWESMSGAERLSWADALRERTLAGGAGLLGPGEDDD